MTEDITFCQNGWEECLVTRCERHPSNIENPQIPHSYAKLYRTEYCPLEKPQPIDVVEVVRCKDCKHWRRQTNYAGAQLSFGFCESDDMWRSLYGETYEVSHIDTDDDFYCGYAERREDG